MIGLIDADGFFASCELSRSPHLRGKPVMVLGRIGSFVLAKTQEAKLRGVTTVMPYWEAKKRCPDGIFLEGDFKFYTLMSRRLMAILKTWSPTVQVSSIDEAYMDLSGIEKMHKKTFLEVGDAIRSDVWQQLGITVTVGISANKVLAKMACEAKKPNGTVVLKANDIMDFLMSVEVGKIPGIGRQRLKSIQHYGIHSAKDLAKLPMTLIKQLFGKNGIMLWRELHGDYMFRVDSTPRVPKQIGRTSSLPRPSNDMRIIEGLSFYHLERSIESLHQHDLAAGEFRLYLRDQEFKSLYLKSALTEATDDFVTLAGCLKQLIAKIPPGRYWRSAGILLVDLRSSRIKQLSLFEGVLPVLQKERLNKAKDDLNKRFGQFTVSSASHLFFKKEKKKDDDRRLGIFL